VSKVLLASPYKEAKVELQVISFAEALSSRRQLTSSRREVRPVAVVLVASDTLTVFGSFDGY
jgi:hypothetical protein